MADSQELDLNQQLLDLLLDKIETDTYPSTTLMNMAEELLSEPQAVQRYAQILLDKAKLDNYPSLDILDRVRSLADITS